MFNKMKNRILLANHGFEKTSLGGPTTRTQLLARSLSEAGYNADVRFLNRNLLNRMFIRRFDIIHLFNIWPVESSLFWIDLAKDRCDCVIFSPIILDISDIHKWSDVRSLMLNNNINFTTDLKPMEDIWPDVEGQYYRTISKADHIVCLSQIEKSLILDRCQNMGIGEESITIIPNAASPVYRLASRVEEWHQQFRSSHSVTQPYVLCVARIERRKNQLLLLEATRRLGITCVLIGQIGDRAYYDLLRSHFSFVYVERVEPGSKELIGAYVGAECLALPSFAEGAPLAAIEALSVGTPILVSKTPGNTDQFKDSAKYCDPFSVDSIAKGIENTIRSPGKLGPDQLYDFAASNFNWSDHVTAHIQVYDHVHQGHRS